MKIFLSGVAGFLITVVVLSVIREVTLSGMPNRDIAATAAHWIGSLRWLYDYQTLIALIGAWWAASAVYAQIRQAERAEKHRIDTKRAALRAALPFTLGSLSEYADTCAKHLSDLLGKVENGLLPPAVPIPEFPLVPSTAVSYVTDLIEVSTDQERVFLSIMLASLQIQNARLASMMKEHGRPGHITLELNLERYIVDVAEVLAQASALYKFARQGRGQIPEGVSRGEIGSAVPLLGFHDDLRERITERYRLEGDTQWVPPFRLSEDGSES
jgi:hypothetical protein